MPEYWLLPLDCGKTTHMHTSVDEKLPTLVPSAYCRQQVTHAAHQRELHNNQQSTARHGRGISVDLKLHPQWPGIYTGIFIYLSKYSKPPPAVCCEPPSSLMRQATLTATHAHAESTYCNRILTQVRVSTTNTQATNTGKVAHYPHWSRKSCIATSCTEMRTPRNKSNV